MGEGRWARALRFAVTVLLALWLAVYLAPHAR